MGQKGVWLSCPTICPQVVIIRRVLHHAPWGWAAANHRKQSWNCLDSEPSLCLEGTRSPRWLDSQGIFFVKCHYQPLGSGLPQGMALREPLFFSSASPDPSQWESWGPRPMRWILSRPLHLTSHPVHSHRKGSRKRQITTQETSPPPELHWFVFLTSPEVMAEALVEFHFKSCRSRWSQEQRSAFAICWIHLSWTHKDHLEIWPTLQLGHPCVSISDDSSTSWMHH